MNDIFEYGDYRTPTAGKIRQMLETRLAELREQNDSPDIDKSAQIAEVKYWQDMLDPEEDLTIADESDDPEEEEDPTAPS